MWTGFFSLDVGVPSPKSHNHVSMLLPGAVDISVNCVSLKTQAAEYSNMAMGLGFTVIWIEVSFTHWWELVTDNVTLKTPCMLKTWVGFCKVEVLLLPLPGSPKFQFQVIMVPDPVVDSSVNKVSLPKHAVSLEKIATGASLMVTSALSLDVHPLALVIVSLTVNVPPAVKACVGFWVVEVLFVPEARSSKSHNHWVMDGPPFVCDKSLNWNGISAHPLDPKLKLARGLNPTCTSVIFWASQLSVVILVVKLLD